MLLYLADYYELLGIYLGCFGLGITAGYLLAAFKMAAKSIFPR